MLEGSLETFPLTAVVRLLEDTGHTGRLSVHAPLGQGSLVFERGRLVDAGPGSDPVEAALTLFEHRNGTFSFRVEPVEGRSLDLDVPRLLDLVEERESAWEAIRASVPQDGPLVVHPLEASDRPGGEVTVSIESWRVAVLANGRTAAQLAAVAGTSEFQACSLLLELLQAGLIGLGSGTTQRAAQFAAPPDAEAYDDDAGEESGEPVEAAPADDADLDPGMLLRELGEAEPPQPSRRRLTRR